MISRALVLVSAFSIGAATASFAEDAHRELGPHVHGHGTLNIAIEASRVSMELEVPGMDIVGFEHTAESKEQKSTVETATKTLSEPLSLFKVPASAGCKVVDAKVKIEAEHDDGDKDHATGEHAGHEGHNAFHVTYALDCAKPENLASIAFDYFKSFAGAQNLTVNVVTAKAQNTYEVSRDKPILDLGGMM